MDSHVEHKLNPFIKWVSRVNPNMTQIHLTSTHNLFINGLIMSNLWTVLDFATPTLLLLKRTLDLTM